MIGKPQLSLAMIVKNEARCLARCLRRASPIVDEIIIVDTGSTDGTAQIARDFNAKVFHFDWVDDFSAARNFSLEQAGGDWILVLDADEYPSEALGAEIPAFIKNRPSIGRLRIVSDFRRHGHTLHSQSFVSRLFPRGIRFQGRIHEQLVSPLPRVNLRGELWHDGYLEIQKTSRNIQLLLGELKGEPDNPYLLYQLAIEYTSVDQSGDACRCLEQAYARMNRSDLFAPNVVVDLLYAEMALKQWDTGARVLAESEKFLDDFPDFHLVRGLFYMNLIRSDPARHAGQLPKIEQSFQRCLALGESDRYKSVKGTGTFLANYNLGIFYHVFGNARGARTCFEAAAAQGYEPAIVMVGKL